MTVPPRDQVMLPVRPEQEAEGASLDVEQLWLALRRQLWVIVGLAGLSVILGLFYLHHVVPRYTATTVVLIGSPKDKTGLSASIADLTYDSGAIDSQLEVLKSERVAQTAMRTLHLDKEPELPEPPPGFFDRLSGGLRSLFGGTSDPMDAPQEDNLSKERLISNRLRSNLDVRRVGRSYVIDINYTSTDPVRATDGANAFAEAYINEQVEARFESIRSASGYLEKRIGELKQKSMNSDLAVQQFQSDHDLISTDGKLVSDQQLADLSGQLVLAESERAKAEARYSETKKLIETKDINGVVSGALENPVISELRQRYLATAQLQAQAIGKVGSGEQPATTTLKLAMDNYANLIFSEMTRVMASYQSDAEVARAKEAALQQSIADRAAKSQTKAPALVQLRELQREADSWRTLYSAFLERMQQVQEGEGTPESEARIITRAYPPKTPTYPNRSVIIVLCIVTGLAAGAGVGVYREYRDNSLRTSDHVTQQLQMEFLGFFSELRTRPPANLPAAQDGARELRTDDAFMRYSVEAPRSVSVESLRAAKIAVDLRLGRPNSKVVGIVSVVPGEGRSMVAKNFASLLSCLGYRVLLVDGDLRNPSLSKRMASGAEHGLLEVLDGSIQTMDAVYTEPETGLSFVPTVARSSYNPVKTPALRTLPLFIERAAESFDYVIFDLPPFGPVVDVRAIAESFDAFILVSRWGWTARELLRTSLRSNGQIARRCVGVLYNRVPLEKISLYERAEIAALYRSQVPLRQIVLSWLTQQFREWRRS